MVSVDEVKKYLKNNLSSYRYEHSLMVADEAKSLANKYKVDENKAYLAGLLHDIAKEFSDEDNKKIILEHSIPLELLNEEFSKIVHADVGALFVKDKFGVDDDICNAIKYHTIGNKNMSLFDKIIFMADKIARKDETGYIKNLKELSYDSIDKALKKYIMDLNERLITNNRCLCKDTLELLKRL